MDAKYQAYLLSNEWKETKEKAYKFHGSVCMKCRAEKNLQVHHATYENIYDEKLTDLCILCETCHELFHKTYGTESIKDKTFIFLNGQEMFDKREEARKLLMKEFTPEQREERLKQIQAEKDRIFKK